MDLFSPLPATKVGESNGRALGYIVEGMSADELRQRYRNGELPELNPHYARAWLAERGRG